MKQKILVVLGLTIGLFGLLLFGNCGPKPIKQESVLDTPENHYKQGLRELEKGNLDAAMEEFNRAKGIDKKYGLAYAGLGLVWAEKGDFDKALDCVDKAIDLTDDKSAEAYVIKGRILTKRRKGDDWWEDAVKQYKKAIKIDSNSGMAYYYMGNTYKVAYEFSKAEQAYRKVIELKGEYAAIATTYGKGRIVLFGPHPEKKTFFGGHIEEFPVRKNTRFTWFIYNWSDGIPSDENYNWWMLRRSVAWTAHCPVPHKNEEDMKSAELILFMRFFKFRAGYR